MDEIKEGFYTIQIPEKHARAFLSAGHGAVLDLEAEPFRFELETLSENPDVARGPGPGLRMKTPRIGHMQVLGTVKADYATIPPRTGPVLADANVDELFGWKFTPTGNGYWIQATTVPNSEAPSVYLTYDPSTSKVQWEDVGGIVEGPPPTHSVWLLNKA